MPHTLYVSCEISFLVLTSDKISGYRHNDITICLNTLDIDEKLYIAICILDIMFVNQWRIFCIKIRAWGYKHKRPRNETSPGTQLFNWQNFHKKLTLGKPKLLELTKKWDWLHPSKLFCMVLHGNHIKLGLLAKLNLSLHYTNLKR